MSEGVENPSVSVVQNYHDNDVKIYHMMSETFNVTW